MNNIQFSGLNKHSISNSNIVNSGFSLSNSTTQKSTTIQSNNVLNESRQRSENVLQKIGELSTGGISIASRLQRFSRNKNDIYYYPNALFKYFKNNSNFQKVFDYFEYIIFEPVEYIPPYSKPITSQESLNKIILNGLLESNNSTSVNINTNISNTIRTFVDEDYHKMYNQGDYIKVDANVYLPMPDSFGVRYGNKWDVSQLNYTSRIAVDMLSSMIRSGNLEAESENIAARIQQMAQSSAVNIFADMAASALGVLGSNNNISGQSITAGTVGVIPNPNVELIFGLPELRTFSFSYKLIALSEEDAEQIRKIISLFKRNMYISTQQSNKSKIANKNRFVVAPNMFRITAMRGRKQNPVLFSFKICALEEFDVNYTSSQGGYISVHSEKNFIPYEVNISMTFRENKILYSQDLEPESYEFTNNQDKRIAH